jgi:hypothetical protein
LHCPVRPQGHPGWTHWISQTPLITAGKAHPAPRRRRDCPHLKTIVRLYSSSTNFFALCEAVPPASRRAPFIHRNTVVSHRHRHHLPRCLSNSLAQQRRLPRPSTSINSSASRAPRPSRDLATHCVRSDDATKASRLHTVTPTPPVLPLNNRGCRATHNERRTLCIQFPSISQPPSDPSVTQATPPSQMVSGSRGTPETERLSI